MGVAKIALMGWSGVNFGLIQGVCDLVRENTGRQTRYQFSILVVRRVQDIVIDEKVVP